MPDGIVPAVTGAVRATYDRTADVYEARWRSYLRESIGVTVAALAPASGESILDVGCGTGFLLGRVRELAPQAALAGVDLSPGMLHVARGHGLERVSLSLADVASLPFHDGTFDAVVSSSSLHHWPDAAVALAEIARVTRPGGRIVITDWCRDVHLFKPLAWWLVWRDPSVSRIYRAGELESLMGSAGLEVRSTTVYRIARIWGMMTIEAERGRA